MSFYYNMCVSFNQLVHKYKQSPLEGCILQRWRTLGCSISEKWCKLLSFLLWDVMVTLQKWGSQDAARAAESLNHLLKWFVQKHIYRIKSLMCNTNLTWLYLNRSDNLTPPLNVISTFWGASNLWYKKKEPKRPPRLQQHPFFITVICC